MSESPEKRYNYTYYYYNYYYYYYYDDDDDDDFVDSLFMS